RGDAATGSSFVSRATYGAYMTDLLAPLSADGRLHCLRADCTRLVTSGSGVAAHLDDGRIIPADSAVLATGHALPDRDPHPRLHALTTQLLDRLAAGEAWFGPWLLWERLLLEETGYGLDLSACAVTGALEGLAYVSPRTGRAVTAEAAGVWADRLLPLPPLLLDAAAPESRAQMAQGLRTTGF
ncbi:MAG: DNA repair protein RecO C-terminal domain-containing protein, partial [Pararhodobacter sp.]